MKNYGAASFLAPFKVRSYRFQWPADLATSWAFEMETIILGWYVLVQTESVILLTIFGSLQFLGTLIAPMLGLVADKVGRRTMLCIMRAFYTAMAAVIMTAGLTDHLTPYLVFAVAALVGLGRPSDLVMRNSLIGDTMPPGRLMNALGLSRTTQDSARIAGALAGAGLFSILGIGAAYIFVTVFYAASFLLTLGVSNIRPKPDAAEPAADGSPGRPSFWREMKVGIAYVWNTPRVLAIMCLAFLVNLTAYPMSNGLLPYVAKEVYMLDENGLGQLVAGYASGALLASLLMAWTGGPRRPARFMLIYISIWYALLLVLGQLESRATGAPTLVLIGLAQGAGMVTMSVTLLSTVTAEYRGRVMGVRALAIYGLPLGLMGSGVLIGWIGYATTITVYCIVGITFTALIGLKWRATIWH
ncbi:MAG: MFS transporter [Alphaproteobacteria bacterium]|nr:MFS transporter [Alphaproteobacteria bacterium]